MGVPTVACVAVKGRKQDGRENTRARESEGSKQRESFIRFALFARSFSRRQSRLGMAAVRRKAHRAGERRRKRRKGERERERKERERERRERT